jgi:endogenous inhibitor of DNA gyrase (YacG/DUF329 family)
LPTGSTNFKEFTCTYCGNLFSRYIPPSDKKGSRDFCSRSCQMKYAKNSNIPVDERSGIKTVTCEYCKKDFEKYVKASQFPKFCSKKCSNIHKMTNGDSAFCGFEKKCQRWIEKYGQEEAEKRLEIFKDKKSKATIKKNIGKNLSQSTKEKISKSCTGISNPVKGKTFAQFYGQERAEELCKRHSQKLKEGYASGKLKPTARSKSAPTVDGIRLRSKLELTIARHLEKKFSLKLGETLLYEDPATKVKWIDHSGEYHTYTPDFHDIVNNIVYEVKPSWKIINPTDEMNRKMDALKDVYSNCLYIGDTEILGEIV